MGWVFLVAGAVLVFAVAAAFVGSEAFRLGHQTPAAIFDVDEAVESVADSLPADAQARLTYDEVRSIVLATLEHLHGKGLSAMPGEDLGVREGDDEVVVGEDDVLAVVLGAVDVQDLDVADTDAALVIERLLVHLDQIGALGPPA